MTDDAVISVLSPVTRTACTQMTPQHSDALHASVEQASGPPGRGTSLHVRLPAVAR